MIKEFETAFSISQPEVYYLGKEIDKEVQRRMARQFAEYFIRENIIKITSLEQTVFGGNTYIGNIQVEVGERYKCNRL